MKFLSNVDSVLEDKKLKIHIVAAAPTNEMRFAVYDLSQEKTMAGQIRLAEYVFDHCIKELSIGATKVEVDQLKMADLTDEKTAQLYFACSAMCIEHIMDVDVSEAERKKS